MTSSFGFISFPDGILCTSVCNSEFVSFELQAEQVSPMSLDSLNRNHNDSKYNKEICFELKTKRNSEKKKSINKNG